MKIQLDALAQQLETIAKVDTLPQKTLYAAIMHTDDVLGVTWTRPVFGIDDLDLDEGYSVFDSDFVLQYNVDAESGLEHQAFGTRPEDAAWFLVTPPGQFSYLSYVNSSGVTRVILVIRG